MKFKFTILVGALALSLSAYSQFFDTVPYRGAFGLNGSTKATATGYNPDPTNTDADWTKPWANWDPINTAYPGDASWAPTAQFPATTANKIVVSGDIAANIVWDNQHWYELSGTVHVLSGATLTIQPGTVVRGSLNNVGVLIIAKGGKINAIGTKSQPIVITSGKASGSRVRGDWGGLLLIGNAHTNTPGGSRQYEALPSDPLTNYGGGANYNDADNSGTIRYMRVEFGGYNYLPDQEINGVTFAGVGSGTKVDYVQVSYANDDSYEWFGGAVNHKYLIAFSGTDDDFDMDEGYNGKCQYLLGVRNPAIFETSPTGTSNGFEHDNNTNLGTATQVTPGITNPTPTTAPVISNMTLVGPIKPGSSRTSLSSTAQARYGRALELRSNTATSVFNSVIWGYPTLFQLGNPNATLTPSVQTRFATDEMSMRNLVFIGGNGSDVRFNSTNPPTVFNGNPFAFTLTDMRNILMNGPAVGFTGATGTDTARATLTSGVEITSPVYSGNSNGALGQLNFTGVDYTLAAGSPFATTSSFSHPKILTTPQPSIAVNPSSIPAFNLVLGQALPVKWVLVSALNLGGNVTVAAPASFEVSLSRTSGFAASITKNGPSLNDTVFIRYNRSTVGSNTGFVRFTSSVPADFAPINIPVNGSASAPASPYVNISIGGLTFTTTAGTASAEKWFNVAGAYLTGNVTVTAPAKFEVSATSGSGFASTATITAPVDGKLMPTSIFVRYNPTAPGVDNGKIAISTAGAEDGSVDVSGTSTGSLTVSPSAYAEWQITAGTASIAYPVTVTGVRLTDSITVIAPTNFQLSVDSAFTTPVTTLTLNNAKAASFTQKIWVRYNAASATTNSGNIAFASPGITTANTAVVGRSLAIGAKILTVGSPAATINFTTLYTVPVSTPSTASNVTINAANLSATDSVRIITTNFNFEVSADNGVNYNDTLFLVPTAGTISTTLKVRYNPIIAGSLNQQMITALWNNGAAQTTPAAVTIGLNGQSSPILTVAPATVPKLFATVGKTSAPAKVVVSAIRLVSDVTINAPASFEISSDSINYSNSLTLVATANALSATNLFVRFKPTAEGPTTPGSAIAFLATNAAAVPLPVNGVGVLAPTPIINLGIATLTPFNTNLPTPTAAQSFLVNALNLTDSLQITVGSDFELSNDSITYKKTWKVAADGNGKITDLKLFCRFNRTTGGSASDTIVISSQGAISGKIAVSGKSTVGVAEVANISSFVMYPNPANTAVTIDFMVEQSAEVNINVIDLMGRVVKHVASENFTNGSNSVNFDVADLNNGFYFVNIESLKGSKTSRLMIAK